MLCDIEPETILFLSKLKKLQIKTDTGDKLTILKDNSKAPWVQILTEGKRQGESLSDINKLLLHTKTIYKPEDVNHEKRREINERDISIAFPLDESTESAGKIFAYLPVRSDTSLPFLINADFILPSSREDIKDEPWNRWLMGCVANLVADALPLLKEKKLLTVALLEKLVSRIRKFDEGSMFYPIAEAVREALRENELLPADDGTFVSGENAMLGRGAELRKLLSSEQLKELFPSKGDKEIKWISGEITEHDLWKYIREELQVEEIRPESFAKKIDEPFLKNQTDDWIISFYQFLKVSQRPHGF